MRKYCFKLCSRIIVLVFLFNMLPVSAFETNNGTEKVRETLSSVAILIFD